MLDVLEFLFSIMTVCVIYIFVVFTISSFFISEHSRAGYILDKITNAFLWTGSVAFCLFFALVFYDVFVVG